LNAGAEASGRPPVRFEQVFFLPASYGIIPSRSPVRTILRNPFEKPSVDAKRYKLFACEIVFREVCALAAESRNIIDPVFIRKGLHDIETPKMLAELQRHIDSVEPERYQAILMGYGRCNDGLVGLRAPAIPLVIPRAHDCITLFLGSKERYRQYFDSHPGTYFRTSGWIERNFASEENGVMRKLGLDKTYEQYVEEYGEDNARYIMEMVGGWQQKYERLTFIDTGLARHLNYAERTRSDAQAKGWQYEELGGDLDLLRRLLDGDWDDSRFVIVPPGHSVIAKNDETVLGVVGNGPAPRS
jgi:hypothetical protein